MTFDLQRVMRAYGRQKDLAAALGVSVSRVSAMYTGKKPPSPALLEELGYERVVTIRPKDLSAQEGESK